MKTLLKGSTGIVMPVRSLVVLIAVAGQHRIGSRIR